MPAIETTISDVLFNYARAIDTKDWILFRGVFTDDCSMVAPAGTTWSGDQLTERMRAMHEPLDGSVHRVSNVQVRVSGDRATSRSYLDALIVRAGVAEGETFRVTGTYDDELVLTTDGWRIHRRRFTPLWREGNPRLFGVDAIPDS